MKEVTSRKTEVRRTEDRSLKSEDRSQKVRRSEVKSADPLLPAGTLRHAHRGRPAPPSAHRHCLPVRPTSRQPGRRRWPASRPARGATVAGGHRPARRRGTASVRLAGVAGPGTHQAQGAAPSPNCFSRSPGCCLLFCQEPTTKSQELPFAKGSR